MTVQLTAELCPEMKSLLDDKKSVFDLLEKAASPLAVSLPAIARRAADDFKETLQKSGVQYRIFAAHKATDRVSLVLATREVAGVDVASLAEFEQVVKCGYRGDEIIATGPKNDDFLQSLAVSDGTVIVVDSMSELKKLAALRGKKPRLKVLLRLTRTMINRPGITKKVDSDLTSEVSKR